MSLTPRDRDALCVLDEFLIERTLCPPCRETHDKGACGMSTGSRATGWAAPCGSKIPADPADPVIAYDHSGVLDFRAQKHGVGDFQHGVTYEDSPRGDRTWEGLRGPRDRRGRRGDRHLGRQGAALREGRVEDVLRAAGVHEVRAHDGGEPASGTIVRTVGAARPRTPSVSAATAIGERAQRGEPPSTTVGTRLAREEPRPAGAASRFVGLQTPPSTYSRPPIRTGAKIPGTAQDASLHGLRDLAVGAPGA